VKVAILAGGKGSRLAEETSVRPKPMVEIGGRPMLWHIMKIYSHHGFNEFAVALGYRGDDIKRYFADYATLAGDLTIRVGAARPLERHQHEHAPWSVDLIETGEETLTGGRVRRLKPHLGEGTFMLTYGDGLADIGLGKLVAFHRSHGRLATLTAVRPPARFGRLRCDGDQVIAFEEKRQSDEDWVNGGFLVLEPKVIDYIEGDMVMLEQAPLENLAREGQLMAYRHEGFWAAMDTLREKNVLETLWVSGERPWAVWEK
jgi:glucose-1-phosphate cytidylyltransferase